MMSGAREAATVLVPLGGTLHAAAAVPVAKTLASLLGATLHFVHVAGESLLPREAEERLGLPEEALRAAVVHEIAGPPATAIVRLAREREAALIVLCRRTTEERVVAGLGAVAEEVLRDAPCPVVIVPPERGLGPFALREILLPQDGTNAMAVALAPAATLADRAGASLVVLHVTAPGSAPAGDAGALSTPRYVDQSQHEWPAWSQEFLDRLSCACPHLTKTRLRFLLGAGNPADEIVRVASALRVDLVALGWRGSLEVARAATLKAVVENVSVPVMVAPPSSGVA